MLTFVTAPFVFVCALLKDPRELAVENVALRQQLAVFKRERGRPVGSENSSAANAVPVTARQMAYHRASGPEMPRQTGRRLQSGKANGARGAIGALGRTPLPGSRRVKEPVRGSSEGF